MGTKKIEDIKTHPLFEGLFTINAELLTKIQQNMSDENYDDSQPIILAPWAGQDDPVCIDGHTRLKAATNAGIEEIAVYSYDFETEEDAFEYAIRLQSNRRNLNDGDLIHCIERLHQQRPRGGDRKSADAKESIPQRCGNDDGRSAGAKRTADLLNISCRKVEQALTVIKHGTPETKDAVLKNEMSINGAYQKTQKERKQTETTHTGENSKKKSIEKEVRKEEVHDLFAWASHTSDLIGQQRLSALNELGGSLKEHLASAIDLYLESLREEGKGNPVVSDHGHVDDDDEYFDPDRYVDGHEKEELSPPLTETNDGEEDDDDEEVFDPLRDIAFDSFK